jgi:ketosteroid isomerase-like protein
VNRRSFNAALLGSMGSVLINALPVVARAAGGPPLRCSASPAAQLTGRDLRAYIDAFNRSDFDTVSRYYKDDLEFEGRGRHFHNREEMLSFYRTLKSRMRETINVRSAVVGRDDIAAELETELYALEDWPDFFGGPMKRGDTLRSLNFVWYEIRDRQFTRIRSARYKRLEAPGSGQAAALDQCDPPPPTLSAESFKAYIDAFNRGDYEAYGPYYTDDVVLVIVGEKELRGHQAVFDFYKGVRTDAQRTIQVNKVISSGNHLAAELQSEFVALEDSPNFIAGPMRRGGRIFINTFVFYDLRGGKFARIRSAEFRKIPRP